ncbi:putative flavoprotein [Dactylonectria estremocensis]|uniref:Flavoprotein n=1 Tax=Dactylonectria estremocensis TaxID=1079267 RepID=A0A9P9EVZ5_9HYPO|nr:putative flavoprotein [Dactylonectria estremocensis]
MLEEGRTDGKMHVLLAASGSVATIKLVQIINGLAEHRNLSVRVILTGSAMHFLAGQSSEQPTVSEVNYMPNVDAVYTDASEWAKPWKRGAPILHINLRKWADVLVVAPLSANTMAKVVNGMCDNLLTSVIRAWDATGTVDGGQVKKIVVAPSMNTAMWRHPITAKQIKTLEEEWGGESGWVEVLRPVAKALACGDVGDGGMVSWQTIVAVIEDKIGIHRNCPQLLTEVLGLLLPLHISRMRHVFRSVLRITFLPLLVAGHSSSPAQRRIYSRRSIITVSSPLSIQPFKAMDLRSHNIPSSSNLWDDNAKSSSTLRTRLRSQDAAVSTSSQKALTYNDVYQQFRACFGVDHGAPVSDTRAHDVTECPFAQAGMNLHASATAQLVEAHTDIQSKISRFVVESSATLSKSDDLYSNIAYPLSATLCHSDNFPRASIQNHLANQKVEIAAAKEGLRQLGAQWDACVQAELDAWNSLMGETNRRDTKMDEDAAKMTKKFKAEAESIVRDQCKLLGDMEKEFRAKLQAESMRLMQMMIDE